MDVTRRHWSVKNSFHWVLDVVYDEDSTRLRKDHADEKLSALRRIAFNMLRQDTWKETLPQKRIRVAHDLDYMLKLFYFRTYLMRKSCWHGP